MEQNTTSFTDRYRNAVTPPTADIANATATSPTTETVQDFVAYLYSVIRHDPSFVQLIDRALKERYDTAPSAAA